MLFTLLYTILYRLHKDKITYLSYGGERCFQILSKQTFRCLALICIITYFFLVDITHISNFSFWKQNQLGDVETVNPKHSDWAAQLEHLSALTSLVCRAEIIVRQKSFQTNITDSNKFVSALSAFILLFYFCLSVLFHCLLLMKKFVRGQFLLWKIKH